MNYTYLPPVTTEKLIPCSFGRIQHISGSRMIDTSDKLLNEKTQKKYIFSKREPRDTVIITEKIDGMNAGVIKKHGMLYPITKSGYDVRTLGSSRKELVPLGVGWALWVDIHYPIYNALLAEGERLVFENAIFTHTLKYRFDGDPVFLLAKYNAYHQRMNYHDLSALASSAGLRMPPLLSYGPACPPEIILRQYPDGLSGSKDGIEGIVYYYEHNGMHDSCAKFVSNAKIGTTTGFSGNMNQLFNPPEGFCREMARLFAS